MQEQQYRGAERPGLAVGYLHVCARDRAVVDGHTSSIGLEPAKEHTRIESVGFCPWCGRLE